MTNQQPLPPPHSPNGPAPYDPTQPLDQNDVAAQRSVAVLTHVVALVAFIFSLGWAGFLVPLIVWFIYKNRSPFVRRTAAGTFNFALSVWVMNVIATVCFWSLLLIPVAIVIWVVVFLVSVWCHIRGAMLAYRGEVFRYPFQIPVLR